MSTIKDVSRMLSVRLRLPLKDSEQFVNDFLLVVKDALNEEGMVKIKGLGTFRLQTMRERESVDVNTGMRVLIGSHDRLTFTPDNTMKEAVNKPFAHFETVVLNEGVEFDDTPEENEQEMENATATESSVNIIPTEEEPQTPVIEEPQVPVVEPVIPVVEPVISVAPVVEPQIPIEKPESISEPVLESEAETVKEPVESIAPVVSVELEEESEELEAKEEIASNEAPESSIEENEEQNDSSFSWLKVLGMIAACFVIFLAGVVVGRFTANAPLLGLAPTGTNVKDTVFIAVRDTIAPQPVDTIPAVATEAVSAPDTVKAAPVVEKANENIVKTTPAVVKAEPATDSKYDYDPRVRTGAYRIVGVKQTHTVKAGETIKSISRFYLGPDMECYVEVLNPGVTELQQGQKIKIPELKLKKKVNK